MEIIRFALGIRFAPSADPGAYETASICSKLLSEVPKKRFAGMKLYAGHCALDDEDDPRILTVVTMGQGIKKTKALYRSIVQSPVLSSMLADHRPIILTNAIARLEGLTFLGDLNKKGELIKADSANESDAATTSEQ